MPDLLAKRGGAHYSDVATESVAAIYNDANEHIVCSTLNRGAIPDLPADAVVQVSSFVGGAGAQPVAFGPLPASARGYLQLMWNMQRLVEEAAVTGDYGALMEAVALNPQTPAGTTAQRVIDELLVAHKAFLPQFANKIAELEAAGITIKDDTVRDLCAQGL
jgi:6-phospho-beta-glucosidase